MIGDEELRIFLWAEDTVSRLEHSCSGEMFLMERVRGGWKAQTKLFPNEDLLKLTVFSASLPLLYFF